RVSWARLAISTLSHWLARQRLNYTTGRSLSKQREEPVHPGDFMYLLPPIPNVEDYSGSDKAVTTCRLTLQTVGIVDIQQLLALSSRLSWASLSGPRWSWPVLACLNWVLASLLVHPSLNRCSDNFCDFMSGQSVLVTCILALKCNLHFLKDRVWFRDFID